MKSSLWIRLLLALTALKLLGGVAGFAWNPAVSSPVGDETVASPLFRCLLLLCFAAAGLFLLSSGASDRRAITLGSFFFLLAAPFAYRPLLAVARAGPPGLAWPALFLYVLPPDAFLPWFFWTFAQEFPNSVSSFKVQRLLGWGRRVTLAAGFAGVSWQLLRLAAAWARSKVLGAPGELAYVKPSYEFYTPLMLLILPAFLVLLWRTWGATGEEGRRARLFVAGLVAGLAPLFLEIVLEQAIPPYEAFLAVGSRRAALGRVIIFPSLGIALFTTAYSVLVAHVLNVKLIARRALQYALARYSALGLAVVPLAALVAYLYEHRSLKLEQIFSGPQLVLLVSSTVVGMAALRYRKTLLDSIDRHFFRDQYDARQTLTLLVERIRATHGVPDLANLICREIDLALHPESVSLMALDPRSGVLADPKSRGRRLDASSSVATLIASASDPLTVDLEDPRSPLARLPEKERYWLVDSGLRLLVPILARDGSLLGLIGLGEKKSGLPFFRDDRQLLRAIANSAAWVLELELGRSLGSSQRSWPEPAAGEMPPPFPEPGASGAELAKECPNCGRLFASFTVFCSSCSRRLEPSHVPYVLPGKFRFERRIGTGGMGVVYRGSDLALGRPVAVKTLRRVSPEDAMRLRREARTAAAVSHRHLAPVYGMETWQGTPMLVMELLEGGTLGLRIEKGRLAAAETVELGIAMAEALEHLHASDILHRDIKPSNIGYTRDGTPKLMDFGIARVMFDLRRDLEVPPADDPEEDSVLLPPTSVWNRTPTSVTVSKQLVGTLSYLSPEALNGQPADTSFDLWSLSIVLYECLIGRKIFTGGDMQQLMNRIRHGRVPDFAQACPEHDELLGDFFRSALHKTITRRPASARELKERLAALRPRLAA
ncbi:MAG TPA: serine/threonine-protein kinase [Thermoanaerobaculia bacterium]|nr:serine/threonine-protein kinase [Thermoanaerobaculia bacterium]